MSPQIEELRKFQLDWSRNIESTRFDPNKSCKNVFDMYHKFCVRNGFPIFANLTSDQVRNIVGAGCSNDILKQDLIVYYDKGNDRFDMYL